jgi:hypothetical protein
MQLEQVNRRKNDDKSDENMTNLFLIILISFWLGFQIYLVKSLKSICQAPVHLIDKRGLICDHSQYVDICLLLGKYLLLFLTAIDFRNFKTLTF